MAFMQNLKICCEEKRRLLVNCNLFNFLEIDPPYLLLNEFKKCRSYKYTVTIKNVYTYPKTIGFRNNFFNEIKVKNLPEVILNPDQCFSVDIFFEPNCSRNCYEDNKRYSFIVVADHPKVGYEIPVIIKKSVGGLSTPEHVLMDTTSPNVPVYFSFPIINFTMEPIPFQVRVKGNVENLRYSPCNCTIPRRSLCMVYLETVSPSMCPVLEELVIRFANQFKAIVRIEGYMMPPVLHPSDRIIRFPVTQLGVKVEEGILLCNESNEIIKYKWCRHETQDESQNRCTDDCRCMDDSSSCPVKQINEYFDVKPKGDFLASISSESALFSFTPPDEFDDETVEPPYEFRAVVYLACSTVVERMKFTLIGTVEGPKIEILSNEKDLGRVYVGEKKCCEMIFTNAGQIKGKIEFAGTDGRFGGIVKADLKSEEIEPLQSIKVTVEYFATSIGQFVEKLLFKVKNGKQLSFILKGTAIPLSLKVNPSKLDFGDIPYGIIQKKYLEITNTLKIPVVVSLKVYNDGDEQPLILFVDEEKFQDEINNDNNDDDDKNSISSDLFSENQSHTHYSFWTLSKSMPCRGDLQNIVKDQDDTLDTLDCDCDMYEDGCLCEDEESCISSDRLRQSTRTSGSKISTEFHEILDNVSLLAMSLVTNAIETKIAEESEPEDKIISTILDKMYTFEHINKEVENLHFIKKNWTKTPKNPREVLLGSNSIYMDPQQTIQTLICVVTNRTGLSHRNLTLRFTPISEKFEEESIEICSRALSETIPITYNCVLPILHLNQTVHNIETHVGVSQHFFLRVKNLSKVAGFVCFNIIPKNNVVEMLIYPRKFLIKPEGWRKIHFKITPSRVGETFFTGIIAILGNKKPMIYKIIVNAKPAAISIKPNKIKTSTKVLINNENVIQITNISPAEARVNLSLEKTHYMHVMPKEAILPPGVTVDVKLFSFFRDNIQYVNNLLVDVEYSGSSKVNIRYDVQGIPLIVECNNNILSDGFDFGTLYTSCKPYKALVTFTNGGEKQYKLFITKVNKSTQGFKFGACTHILDSGEKKSSNLEITAINPQTVVEEFSFDVLRAKEGHRIHFFTYTFKARFIKPLMKWSKENLCFEFINSQLCDKKDNVIDNVILENKSELPIVAELKVEGSFKLFNAAKGTCPKQLQLSIQPKESKMLEVIFTPKKDASKRSAIYQGRVLLESGGQKQKSLSLVGRVVFPVVEIDEGELDYFARQQEFYAFFKIWNPGQLPSGYKWQLKEETECPLNYINTSKMKKQKNVSQQILKSIPNWYLDYPINLEKEYLDTLPKLANLAEESDNEEEEQEQEIEDSTEAIIKLTTPNKPSKDMKNMKKKPMKTTVKNKNEKEKKSETSKQQLNTSKKNTTGRNKKSSLVSVSESIESISKPPSLTTLDIENIKKYITQQISVDLQEVVEEVREFIYSRNAKNSEDIIDTLEPEHCKTEVNQPDKYIYLDHYKGCISPETKRDMTIFFAGHDREITHKARYEVEVAAGNTTGIDINIFNINASVQISQTHFDFGYQPWYKVFQQKLTLTNCNQMTMKINIAENAYLDKYHKLYRGFLTVIPNGIFYILNDMIVELTCKIYLGFPTIFKDGFGVEVNNNIATPITFTSRVAIPMISILNVERPFLEYFDRKLEYQTLNNMFLKEVDLIKVLEVEPRKTELYKLQKKLMSLCLYSSEEEESLKSQCNADSSEWSDLPSEFTSEENFDSFVMVMKGQPKLKDLYIGKDGRVLKFKDSQIDHRAAVISKLDKELKDYHVLDYPDEYPTILYIEKMIETSKFLESLKLNEEVQSGFKALANKYVLTSLKNETKEQGKKKTTIKIKDFVVEPLPFLTTSYYLPFEFIKLNEELSFTLELFSHGPGKLALAARTAVAIPGFKVEFTELSNEESSSVESNNINLSNKTKFLVYATTPEITQEFKYMNKTERDIFLRSEAEANTSSDSCDKCQGQFLCRKHSYDLDCKMIHTRGKPDRKAVNEYYSSLLKEKRDPFVLCQLLQEDCCCMDEISFGLTIKFLPTDEFYDEGMIFEDFLFIDVHLGPSVPILLQGPIKNNFYSSRDSSEINSSQSKTDLKVHVIK